MSLTPGKAMEAQFLFQRRLKEHGVTIYFLGMSDDPSKCIPSRWEVIRTAIVDFGVADTDFGSKSGVKESYRTAFERAAEMPLIPAKQEEAA